MNKIKKKESRKILESKRIIQEAQDLIKNEKLNIKKNKKEEFKKTKFYKFIKKTFKFIKFDQDSYSFSEVLMVTVLSLLIGAFSCFSIFTVIFGGSDYLKVSKELSKIVEVYEIITEKYNGEIDKGSLTDAAINGMISSVGDEYTGYYDSSSKEDFDAYVNGKYSGIGCTITVNDKQMVIVEVFENAPADKAGLLPGDIILSVNDQAVDNLTLDEVSEYIKKSTSSTIKMIVLRDKQEVKLEINKDVVETPSVSSKTYEIDGKKIGYLNISTFSMTSSDQFKTKVKKLEKEGINGLIIDVRGNSGGYLTAVTDIVSQLLPIGKTIYKIKKDDKVNSYVDKTFAKKTYPIAVLVNGSSASASEILAAAIKESYNGYVVGSTTYGKGKVQQTMPLSDGSMIKVTVENWLTPDGNWVDAVGIEPTHYVTLDEEYYDDPTDEKDMQLQKALELVSK